MPPSCRGNCIQIRSLFQQEEMGTILPSPQTQTNWKQILQEKYLSEKGKISLLLEKSRCMKKGWKFAEIRSNLVWQCRRRHRKQTNSNWAQTENSKLNFERADLAANQYFQIRENKCWKRKYAFERPGDVDPLWHVLLSLRCIVRLCRVGMRENLQQLATHNVKAYNLGLFWKVWVCEKQQIKSTTHIRCYTVSLSPLNYVINFPNSYSFLQQTSWLW